MYRISLVDQFEGAETRPSLTLDLEPSDTLRDIIRRRVQAESKALARDPDVPIIPLVPAPDTPVEGRRRIDWEAQYRRAIEDYRHHVFFVVIDGKQAADLDIPLEFRPNSRIEFVRTAGAAGR